MLLNRETAQARWMERPDGEAKVTGQLAYLTDMSLPGMLFGKVLRSAIPHGVILSLDTSEARKLPGVHAVITSQDVPGVNRFGISMPDQPVLCEDRVRYIGDALAAVAAETPELAEQALELISVEYEELPVVDDPRQALDPASPRLHPGGNLLHRSQYARGEAEDAMRECFLVVEETYETPRQMHIYMETEGGLFVPEEDGRLTVYSPTQHGYKDRMQLARILGVPDSRLRVVSSPIGGSFGGKDELNVQPFGAMLAIASQRPVKMHNTRRESVRSSVKRHPMSIAMRTGVDAEGRLIAHQVRILADTGAYASLGREVLNFATEHAVGPYRIPHVEVTGESVYTNNGVSGEFRGFGGNQVIFALEGQMDRLAHELGMDPLELRRRNLRQAADLGPFGQRVAPTDGALQVWEKAAASSLRSSTKRQAGTGGGAVDEAGVPASREPWRVRGIGTAVIMHGSGLGFGIPDFSGGRVELCPDGKIEGAFGFEEFGQGIYASLTILMTETLGCGRDDIRIVLGDTDRVPSSGSSTASRATSMAWGTLTRIKQPFLERLLAEASALTGRPPCELAAGPGGVWLEGADGGRTGSEPLATYAQIASFAAKPISADAQHHYPTTPDAHVGAHFLYGFASVVVEVEVNLLTGRVKVVRTDHAIAAGPVVNPMGYLGQIEGGASMALGFTLYEDALMQNGRYATANLDTYLVPTFCDAPETVTVEAIEELPEGDSFGPRGVGELGTVALAPAVASAIFDATGVRVTKLPVSPELLIRKFHEIVGGDAS